MALKKALARRRLIFFFSIGATPNLIRSENSFNNLL
jgi:hypothetical protein